MDNDIRGLIMQGIIKQNTRLLNTITKNSIKGSISPYRGGGQGDTRYITAEIDTANGLIIQPTQATAAIYSRSSGTVPITFTTTGSKLEDYTINGTYEGVGDSSINYFSGTLEQGTIDIYDGQLVNSAARLRPTDYVELEAGDYLVSIEKSNTGQNLNFSAWLFLYGAGDNRCCISLLQ
jgi:hypothetical protein